jgi:hypothetical protein
LTNICNLNGDDLDLKLSTILWAYKTTCKKIIGQTPFRLVYGKEEVVPLDNLIPSLCIAVITNMTEEGVVQLKYLAGKNLRGLVNGSRLKLYQDSRTNNLR